MQLLFKHRKREPRQENNFSDKVAAGIVQKCIKMQLRWADFMQRKTEKLSLRARKNGLLLFCFFSVGCSLYLVIASFKNNKSNISLSPIQVPAYSIKSGEESTRSASIISKAEVGRIDRFRGYMDSLGQSAQGLEIRDSILLRRPGLMDSIRVLEKFYRLQTLNK